MKGDKHYNDNKALLQSMLVGLREDKMALVRQKKSIEDRIENIGIQQRGLTRILQGLEEEENASH